MSEEHEFRVMEERQRQEEIRRRAEAESIKFIDSHSTHGLASLSLRQAFEYGYRYGCDDRDRGK